MTSRTYACAAACATTRCTVGESMADQTVIPFDGAQAMRELLELAADQLELAAQWAPSKATGAVIRLQVADMRRVLAMHPMTARPEQESETPITDGAWDIAQALTLRQRSEHMRDCARQLERELSALTARERDALDAKRYRWLKEHKLGYNGVAWHWKPGEPLWDDNIDAAIDRALTPSTGGSSD